LRSQRVVMITPHGDPLGRIGEPDIGGQCIYIRELSSALVAQGTRVLAFTRDRWDGKASREQIAPGAEVIRIRCGPKGFLPKEKIYPYLSEFAGCLSSYLDGSEVISSHFWDGGFVASVLQPTKQWIHTSHSLGKRKLASVPQADASQYTHRIATETEILKQCNAIIASTGLEKQDLVKLYRADKEKITVIPPGVDTNRFHQPSDKLAIKKRLGFSADPLVLALGRLDPRKGFDLYFRAAARAKEILGEESRVQFVLSAGVNRRDTYELKERDRLANLIQALSIGESVRWLPVMSADTLPLYYRAADLFVMPSRYELFGIVILEAMASGIPVLATKFGGPPEIVDAGENGELVDPTDINAFATAIADLIRDPKKRQAMGDAARRKIEASYCWDKLASRHQQIYARNLDIEDVST